MTDSVRKRSVTLDGHRTSLSIEQPFWDALKDLATEQGTSLSALIQAIDHDRDDPNVNLSGALRVYVLRALQRKAGLCPDPQRGTPL
jgi:predicted DNA-binding ribbon-helix-helix protein